MHRIKSSLLLFCLIAFSVAVVNSFPHAENVTAAEEVSNATARQVVLSPQELYLLQLQQTLQQQQNIALAEANRKLLQQQEEDSDEDEDDDPFLRSEIPEDSSEIFPTETHDDNKNEEEDVVYAIVDHGDDDIDDGLKRQDPANDSTSGTVPATVVTVAPIPAETATTHYVNVPESDQPSGGNSEATTDSTSVSTVDPASVSSSAAPSVAPGAPESASPPPTTAAPPSSPRSSSVPPGVPESAGGPPSSVAPGVPESASVAPAAPEIAPATSSIAPPSSPDATSVAPGVPQSTRAPVSGAPESVPTSSTPVTAGISDAVSTNVSSSTPSTTTFSISTESYSAPSTNISTATPASTISSSPTPDSPPNPNLTSGSTSRTPSASSFSASTTPSSPLPSSTSSDIGGSSASTTTTQKPRPRPPYRANLRCRCGTQTTRRLYIGNTRVTTNTYPWTVSVMRNGTHMCTGSIINSKYVLTSASCLRGSKGNNLTIRAALSNPNKKIIYNVNSVSYHPSYRRDSLSNNLALVEVREEIRPSKNVKFVCLPLEDSQRKSDCGTIVNVSEEPTSRNLTMTQQQVQKIPQTRCSALLRREISNDTFCTAPPSRHCGGDTGGSYITPGKGYSFTLRGLVSSTSGCKVRRQPAVFTNVGRYTSWILYKSQAGSYCKVPSFRRELTDLPE